MFKMRYLWALICPLLAVASEFSSVDGEYFEVVGFDNRSVSHVSELAEHIAEESNQYLPDGGVAFPSRILIALRPPASAGFEGSWEIILGKQGRVRLDFKWDAVLTLPQVCSAITEAYLTRYALYQFGPSALENMRAWPVQALAIENYLSLRPATLINLIKESRQSAMVGSSVLLSAAFSSGTSDHFNAHAYFFLSALKSNLADRRLVRLVVDYALSGGDPSIMLAKQLLPSDPALETITLDQWWTFQRNSMVEIDYDLFEEMTNSRIWIEQMANFAVYREKNGEMRDLRKLWSLKENPELREILKARCALIKLRLEVVNPLYYNAARSLGALYEIVLSQDSAAHRFMHTLIGYLGDFEDAKQIEKTTLGLLDSAEVSAE